MADDWESAWEKLKQRPLGYLHDIPSPFDLARDAGNWLSGRKERQAGYNEETAPEQLKGAYAEAAYAPNTDYGNSPVGFFARDKETGSIRPAIPQWLREGLLGGLDLGASTETGDLTQRGLSLLTNASTTAGAVGAEAGALGAGGARRGARAATPPRELPASTKPEIDLPPPAMGGNNPPPGYELRNTKVFPQYADKYPDIGPPLMTPDKKKGPDFMYPAKQLTPEATVFQAQKALVQKDIDEGKYQPYFDKDKRFNVDISKYEPRFDTGTIKPKKDATIEKYETMANDPGAMKRLDEAYAQGMKQSKDAGDWYFMGQLEKEFIDELGAKAGRAAFKEKFADAMAATTGGSSPASNFLTAMYGNFLKQKGEAFPGEAYDVPYPIGGGKYGVMPNLEAYDKMITQGHGINPEANPKKYDFSSAFMGDKNRAVIDEVMSGISQPGMTVPASNTYGIYTEAVKKRAAELGVTPEWLQEVAWAGKKDMAELERSKGKYGFKAQPMIEVVNEAIERTARLTGQTPKEVVRQAIVRSKKPVYSAPGGGVPGYLAPPTDPDKDFEGMSAKQKRALLDKGEY
jgi:hypothetical protein